MRHCWLLTADLSGRTNYTALLTEFQKVIVNDVISAIRRMPDKSCAADTLPTPQLKLVADLIAPFLTELFNRSLSTATVPSVFKAALITPLLDWENGVRQTWH